VIPIEIISASAGSGKTHRLTEILLGSLESGAARPEAIVAVTFTTKAAAELQERARRFLVESDRPEDAQRLAASRISTVHSVCGGLLSEFAFDMGLSPEQNILDEAAATSALLRARSLSGGQMRGEEFADLKSRMRSFDWDEVTRDLLDRARSNGLTAKDLHSCRDRSLETFREFLDPPMKDVARFERGVVQALERFLENVPEEDTTKVTAKACSGARSAVSRLRSGAGLTWDAWVRLAEFTAAKASQDAAAPVAGAAADFHRHPRLRADLERAIELVFDAAADALEGYQAYKQQRGAVDFTDQLTLALEALRTPEIQEQLRGEIDLFLVDEFQDTNPLQLAIFLELARLAKRTVWVGDQKQSIFGFIGTDPALMDAAIKAILRDQEPETLPLSYRSRPELVHLTSDVFAAAFEQVGIPAKRTRLAPAKESEPEGLGPTVERWRLEAGRKNVDVANALATGVRDLLSNPETRVRAGSSPQARQVEPSEVAILCRTHNSCLQVAGALASLGIPSVVARLGLLDTPEARLVVAGLQRWVDGRDTLAAASLARLAVFPPDGEVWLDKALRSPYAKAFGQLPIVQAIDGLRKETPQVGVLEAFDRVAEAVGARDLSSAWGVAEQRLANLDALRALVVAYLELRASEGVPASVAGLLTWLAERSEAKEDDQAELSGSGAVVVSTWHSAKGLEWPITVLFNLDSKRVDNALGVHVVQEDAGFDFADPLANRWVRYWPNPFQPNRKKSFLHERLEEHPENLAVLDQQRRERLRLLYVGWTRARDRVVLVSRAKKPIGEVLDLLHDGEGPLLSEPEGDRAEWAGRSVRVLVRDLTATDPEPQQRVGGESYVISGPQEHPPAILTPSGLSATGQMGKVEALGTELQLHGSPNMNAVGEALHSFFAADLPDLSPKQRLKLAQGLVARWGVADNLAAEDLLAASDSLRTWIEAHWPDAHWHREWPIQHRLDTGSTIHGSADLVLELDDGFVLIDHKSFRSTTDWTEERVASLAGQLGAYAEAIAKATGLELLASWVHLPLEGSAVRLDL